MDGVGVKGDESVLSARARRFVIRLVSLGEHDNTLLGLFERAQRAPQNGWKLDCDERVRRTLALERKSAPKQKQRAFGIGGLPPALLFDVKLDLTNPPV